VNDYQDLRDYDGFKLEAIRLLSVDSSISDTEFLKEKPEVLAQKLYQEAMQHYHHKSVHIGEMAHPVITNV